MKRKALLLIVLLLIGVGAGLGFFWPFGNGAGTLQLHGIVEIQEVRLASKVGGRIKEVLVKEGDIVKPGQVLVEFEAPELMAQKKQLEAKKRKAMSNLKQLEESLPKEIEASKAASEAAKARWEKTNIGWRPEEIDMAKREEKFSLADKEFAKLEWERVKKLYPNSVSKSEYDMAKANLERTTRKHDVAVIRLQMLIKGGWELEKEVAEKEWKQALANYQKLVATEYEIKESAREEVNIIQGEIDKVDVDLKESKVVAPEKAIVEVVGVRAGDVVGPNQSIIRVLRADDLWVKVFVPETDLGKLRLHQKVDVIADAYPGKHFQGEIFQVGSIAEFTPRNVQSKEERRYQVFPVKIRVSDPEGVFRAGMAAEVLVPIAPAP